MKKFKSVAAVFLALLLIFCTVGCRKNKSNHESETSSLEASSDITVSSEDAASSTSTEVTSSNTSTANSVPSVPAVNNPSTPTINSSSSVSANSQYTSSASSENDYIWENGVDPKDPSTYRTPMSMLTITVGLSKAAVLSLIEEMSNSGVNALMFGVAGDVILDDMTIKTRYGTYSLSAFLEGRRYTQKDVDEIIAFAQSLDVEIIPVLQTPGHMSPFLRSYPEFAYPGTTDSLDLTNPEATEFMHAAYIKYGEYFASRGCKYFSVSADEWGHAFDKKGYDYLYNNGEMKYFVDYMNTNIKNLSNLGFEVMAWNDGICYNNDITTYGKIDNRLIVLYWSPGWFGNKFATPEFLENQGYRIVNSYHTYYIEAASDLQERASKLHQFNFWIGNYEIKDPFGGMACVWARPKDNDGGLTTVKSLVPVLDGLAQGINFWKYPIE